jgi:NADH-quinone oxidoreductase subunit M
VYTLNMVQKIFYGNTAPATVNATEANSSVQWVLAVLVIIIIVLGVYPQPLINLTNDSVQALAAIVK